MKIKIIKKESLNETDFGDTKVTDILNTTEYQNISVAIVRKTGDNQKLGADSESDVLFYVLDGEGKQVIDSKEHAIKKGDFIFLPKGTKYKTLKGVTLLAIASPRYDAKKRVYFEK